MTETGSNVALPLVQASLLGEAIDAGPVLVFVASEDMRYVAVNAYACEVLGYTREELLGLTVAELTGHADSAERFREFVSRRRGRGESELVRKDGSRVRMRYRAQEATVAGLALYVSVGWLDGDEPD